MQFEYISLIIGVIKIFIYKIFNFTKIKFSSIPKMNSSFKIAMKNKTKLFLGKGFRTRNNVSIRIYNKGKVTIGDNVFFNDNCSINCQEKITIGNNVICGQNVIFLDHDHDYKNDIDKFICKEIKIGNNVWIGANVVILKGVTIEDNCVIAAGTIVRKNVEANSLIYQERKYIVKRV